MNLNRNLIIFLLLTIFTLLFLRQCNVTSNLKAELAKTKADAGVHYNNLLAANDTIRKYKSENAGLIAEKRSFVYDINEFTGKYRDLANEYSDALQLSKSLKSTNALLKAQVKIKDEIKTETVVSKLNDTTTVFKFNDFKDFGKGNTRKFDGIVKFSINGDKFNVQNSDFNLTQEIKLYASIDEKDGYKKIKMSSTYPGLDFENIENINLINNKLNEKTPKKARWSIGFGVGYGMTLINGQTIQYGPNINAGLYWSPAFLQF
jgi:hypothetical protein